MALIQNQADEGELEQVLDVAQVDVEAPTAGRRWPAATTQQHDQGDGHERQQLPVGRPLEDQQARRAGSSPGTRSA